MERNERWRTEPFVTQYAGKDRLPVNYYLTSRRAWNRFIKWMIALWDKPPASKSIRFRIGKTVRVEHPPEVVIEDEWLTIRLG